jgi:hypothetical protein
MPSVLAVTGLIIAGAATVAWTVRPDGRPNVSAMLRDITSRPSQLSPLARIAADAFAARAAMYRVRRDLGSNFGLIDH